MATSKSKKQMNKAYNSSMNFLASRSRSREEVRNNLYKKKFSDDIISEIIAILENQGLIDDKKFAFEFVSTREKVRPKSKFALKYELKKKGISDEIIEKAICGVDEYQSALTAINPKLTTWLKLDKKKLKTKIMNFLKNRGFNWEISFATWEKVSKELKNKDGII